MIELCLVEYQMLKFPPSLLAAAAIYTAQSAICGFKQWSKTSEFHSGYSQEQLLWVVSAFVVSIRSFKSNNISLWLENNIIWSSFQWPCFSVSWVAENVQGWWLLSIRRLEQGSSQVYTGSTIHLDLAMQQKWNLLWLSLRGVGAKKEWWWLFVSTTTDFCLWKCGGKGWGI